jgi:sortase (surface protein transpeptidase)
VPTSIEIPRIGTRAIVVPLGEDAEGTLDAPADPDTVGWYALGTGLGVAGNALLDGHVDWGGRLRVFGRLSVLEPGDTVLLTDADEQLYTYAVTWTRLYDAADAPLDEIYAPTDGETITLITCGGAFDQAARMYVSRWVVRAERVFSAN